MALGTYKLKRMVVFLFVGVVAPLSCSILFFLSFPLMGILFWSVLIGLFLAAAGYIVTGMNPWIKAIQGDALIVVDINSTGVGKFYSAIVRNNPFGGIDLVIDFKDNEETRVYDRKITHRIMQPLKMIIQPWEKKNETTGELEKKISFSIMKDEFEKCAWHHEYLTFLFYDSETGMFISKPYMREQEKQMQAEYLSLNEWKELKELNKTMRDFTRNTFDLIGQKFGGVFGNPMVKLFIIGIIVIIVIVLAIQYLPNIMATILPATKSVSQATGQLVTPLN